MKRYMLAALVTAFVPATAQPPQTAPRPVVSPEVSADRRVTFRFRNATAKEVVLTREAGPRTPMQKGEDGVWTLTTDPLEPDFYGYTFVADGIGMMDPLNPLIKPNLLGPQSMVYVPGDTPWDVKATVARGTLHQHFYHSGIVGDNRDYFVYTPAGYNAKSKTKYPVLYLLHGYSDDARGWTSVGQAHVILDNLIAQGKARPMLIVMTLGYGAPEIVSRAGGGFRAPGLRERSFNLFRDSLFKEVIPAVEKEYRVATDRTQRAIAGLSMGGAESLFIGLNALDRFAYIGAFSSGGLGNEMAAQFPKLDASANAKLKVFWMSCGTADGLIDFNRKFVAFAKSKGVNVELKETPGAHTWTVWRRNLSELLPLLFQK